MVTFFEHSGNRNAIRSRDRVLRFIGPTRLTRVGEAECDRRWLTIQRASSGADEGVESRIRRTLVDPGPVAADRLIQVGKAELFTLTTRAPVDIQLSEPASIPALQ